MLLALHSTRQTFVASRLASFNNISVAGVVVVVVVVVVKRHPKHNWVKIGTDSFKHSADLTV